MLRLPVHVSIRRVTKNCRVRHHPEVAEVMLSRKLCHDLSWCPTHPCGCFDQKFTFEALTIALKMRHAEMQTDCLISLATQRIFQIAWGIKPWDCFTLCVRFQQRQFHRHSQLKESRTLVVVAMDLVVTTAEKLLSCAS